MPTTDVGFCRILVVRLSSLGDVVLSTAALAYLKDLFPRAEVEVLTYQEYAPLFRKHPCVSQVHTLSRKEKIPSLIRKAMALGKRNFDYLYDAHNVLKSRIFSFFLKAGKKVRFPKNHFLLFLRLKLKLPVSLGPSVVERHWA